MASVDEDECVILSSSDEAEDLVDDSILMIEHSEDFPSKEEDTVEVVDEEVIVTFCKKAKLMPHARHDCTINPFERAEHETSHPLGRNAETCSECYCYICNKQAKECKYWVTPSLCHCNAHNKSKYWKGQWNFVLTGGLAAFNLDLSEIDADVQRGGALLQKFIRDVSVEYHKYLSDKTTPPDCRRKFCPRHCEPCNFLTQTNNYRYSPVSDIVAHFLYQAEQEKPKAEAVMLLGAAKEILRHKIAALDSQNVDASVTFTQLVTDLMERITRRLQRLLVLNDFSKPLYQKFIDFYHSIPFPRHCCSFSTSLDFLTWDDTLLTSVLKGQNVTDHQLEHEKKITLSEVVPVVKARIERMESQLRYKELVRYLKVVDCYDFQWLQQQRDQIPFYLCKSGDIAGGALALFSSFSKSCCMACRLTPSQFEVLLKAFRTGYIPLGEKMEALQWANLGKYPSAIAWCLPILVFRQPFGLTPFFPLSTGGPLKPQFLIKQIIKMLYCNLSLYRNPRCWSAVIKAFSSYSLLGKDGCFVPLVVKEPPPDFQQMVFRESCHIMDKLATQTNYNICLSKAFSLETHMEAGLIFMVQAVRQMVLREHHSLTSFLDIVLAFGENLWALQLLLDSLAFHKKPVCTIVGLTITDLQSRKAEMLALCHQLGPWYVCKLLYLFLASKNRNLPSIGIIIINIIKENMQKCFWAKEVGHFLHSTRRHLSWVSPDVSDFIAASMTLP
ncbi:uncharacterized protein [Anolis sagrei]|uniref:uncharacterized protein isoform X2 n=1 Tax=Anolis sagrei TaxID=38937 RepID=UPI003520926B